MSNCQKTLELFRNIVIISDDMYVIIKTAFRSSNYLSSSDVQSFGRRGISVDYRVILSLLCQ